MTKPETVVAVFTEHSNAEKAVRELERSGFDMKQLSIVGRDYHTEQHVVGYYTTSDRVKYWGGRGAIWGGLWGMLVGWGFFWVPGMGPLLLAGPLVSALLGALQGAVVVGGVSALGAALYSMNIPKESVLHYEAALKSDSFLVVAHGTANDVRNAREILASGGAAEATVHTS